jgi:hypothetical protein
MKYFDQAEKNLAKLIADRIVSVCEERTLFDMEEIEA